MIFDVNFEGPPLMAVCTHLTDAPNTELNNKPAAVGMMLFGKYCAVVHFFFADIFFFTILLDGDIELHTKATQLIDWFTPEPIFFLSRHSILLK